MGFRVGIFLFGVWGGKGLFFSLFFLRDFGKISAPGGGGEGNLGAYGLWNAEFGVGLNDLSNEPRVCSLLETDHCDEPLAIIHAHIFLKSLLLLTE